MRDFGVSVHIIEPGFHKTNITNAEMLKKNCIAAYEALPPHLKEEYGQDFVDHCK